MSESETQGYVEPPAVGDEASTLLGSLERQRATFEWKCADLGADDLARRLDPPETMYELWRAAVERSRPAVLEALGRGGPGATYTSRSGHELTLRRLLVDMIEEYGRHTGQADLLREAIDGRVGEDPPGPVRPFTFA